MALAALAGSLLMTAGSAFAGVGAGSASSGSAPSAHAAATR